MEWREIEVFLTLADELHFGRTAERLLLSQARVSQTVRALERRLGGRLFERTSRQVRLTPLGERFRDELRPGYEQILHAYEAARDSARGIVGELRITATSLMVLGPAIGRIVERFEKAHPMCSVQLRDASTLEGLAQARDGRCDIVAAYLPLQQSDLTVGPVVSRRARALLVPTDHPLAARGYATVEDLGDLTITRIDTFPDETADAWAPSRTPSGRPIRSVPLTSSSLGAVLVSMVARGLVCHPTGEGVMKVYNLPGLTEVPLRGLPVVESALVWVTSRESAAIRAFAACTEAVLAAGEHRIDQPG